MVQALIKTANSLILNFVGGITKKVDSPALIEKVLNAYKAGASDQQILEIIDLTLLIKKHPSGLFGVKDGLVYVDEEAVPDALSSRIIDFANNGLPFEPLIKFWNNCKLNPDSRAKTDLYRFLEHNGIPITSDGCFIAYRAVRNDYMDKYTGKISNHVGSIISMPRSQVNCDPNVTCAFGYHAAAYDYARNTYGANIGLESGDRLMEVKIDPRDVCAIPSDYCMQKMRVCKYEVIAENKDGVIRRPLYDENNVVDDGVGNCCDQFADDGCVQNPECNEFDPNCGECDNTSCPDHPDYKPLDVSNVKPTTTIVNKSTKQLRDSKGRFLPKS